LAIAITAVVVSTAYLAAGALHDRMMPVEDGPVATVTIVAIATDGLGGVQEHLHVPAVWDSDGEYDLGVWVVGLRSEGGVQIKFSLEAPGISLNDTYVRYYDAVSATWKHLNMVDEGDVLVGTLGLQGGMAIYEGYDVLHRLLITSNLDGACQVRAWAVVE
jgi:hypothetical protein